MIPVISVSPDPEGGNFCANFEYTFTADCPNARKARWFVESFPPGFDASNVTFGSDQSLETIVTFAFPGQWIINVECCEPAPEPEPEPIIEVEEDQENL